jgi:hypothetical protein
MRLLWPSAMLIIVIHMEHDTMELLHPYDLWRWFQLNNMVFLLCNIRIKCPETGQEGEIRSSFKVGKCSLSLKRFSIISKINSCSNIQGTGPLLVCSFI